MSKTDEPRFTGGCLCKAISYSISFSRDSYPPKTQTCQCTQCRKLTGTLIAHLITLHPEQISWISDTTLREYNSSAGVFRGFCSSCGSTLTWRSQSTPKEIDVYMGTFDEQVLLGKDGKDICTPSGGQVWCENIIKGVTDGIIGGKKWAKGSRDGVFWDH